VGWAPEAGAEPTPGLFPALTLASSPASVADADEVGAEEEEVAPTAEAVEAVEIEEDEDVEEEEEGEGEGGDMTTTGPAGTSPIPIIDDNAAAGGVVGLATGMTTAGDVTGAAGVVVVVSPTGAAIGV
jgi:hypothetical protein